jgi:hypothetical protein
LIRLLVIFCRIGPWLKSNATRYGTPTVLKAYFVYSTSKSCG